MKIFIAFLFTILVNTSYLFAEIDRTYPLPDDEYYEKIFSLPWDNSNPVVLKNHDATIVHGGEFEYLTDYEDVSQLNYWRYGQEEYYNNFYSYFYYDYENSFDYIEVVAKKFNDDGYIKLDDWKNLKPDDLIKEKRENAKINNKDREAIGIALIDDVQWIDYPDLNKDTNSISYSFKVSWSDGDENMNKYLIILGRKGYTEFEILSEYSNENEFNAAKNLSQILQNNFKYNAELEYRDYKPGDKVAVYGIAALVATSLGVKGLAKAGGLLLALKKFWFILLFPFIFLFKLITGRNKKN